MERILIIDGDQSAQIYLETVLYNTDCPAKVFWGESVEHGKQLLAKEKPDIVILGLAFPDADPVEVINSLCSSVGDVPVIVLTDRDDPNLSATALKAGAQDYLLRQRVTAEAVVRCARYSVERKRFEGGLQARVRSLQKMLDAVSEHAGRLVSPEALQMFDAQNVVEERFIGILFADIRGFTTLTEKYKAETTVELLSYLLSDMAHSVTEEDGHVNKYLGDGLLALFGATGEPEPKEQIAQSLVRAGYKMQARVDIFNLKRVQLMPDLNFDRDLRVGVGIHCGPAIVGFVGPEDRCEFTAIGDNVNIASRLCGIATVNQVLASDAVVSLCGEAARFDSMQSTVLKGKKKQTSYAVVTGVDL